MPHWLGRKRVNPPAPTAEANDACTWPTTGAFWPV
jgi:hypothetical protein